MDKYTEIEQGESGNLVGTICADEPVPGVPAINPGDRFVATVRVARKEGVVVSLPMGGSGTVSPRCWGNGPERMEALGKINPGDPLEVVVRSWDPRTRTASLVLPGFEDLPRLPKTKPDNQHKCPKAPKAAFRPEPQGTTFVFDLANVIGHIPPACIPNAKSAIESRFSAAGYPTLFYLDSNAIGWLHYVLPDDAAKDEFFRNFKNSGNASFTGGREKAASNAHGREADLAVLQTVAAIGNSVACSRDGFDDYAESFPEIVPKQVRQFSVVKLPNQSVVLTIEGAGCAGVVIPPFAAGPTGVDASLDVDAPSEE